MAHSASCVVFSRALVTNIKIIKLQIYIEFNKLREYMIRPVENMEFTKKINRKVILLFKFLSAR